MATHMVLKIQFPHSLPFSFSTHTHTHIAIHTTAFFREREREEREEIIAFFSHHLESHYPVASCHSSSLHHLLIPHLALQTSWYANQIPGQVFFFITMKHFSKKQKQKRVPRNEGEKRSKDFNQWNLSSCHSHHNPQ